MPLYSGKENVGRNIETEIAHGKPRKQAIAIALSVERRGSGDPKYKERKRQIRRKVIGL